MHQLKPEFEKAAQSVWIVFKKATHHQCNASTLPPLQYFRLILTPEQRYSTFLYETKLLPSRSWTDPSQIQLMWLRLRALVVSHDNPHIKLPEHDFRRFLGRTKAAECAATTYSRVTEQLARSACKAGQTVSELQTLIDIWSMDDTRHRISMLTRPHHVSIQIWMHDRSADLFIQELKNPLLGWHESWNSIVQWSTVLSCKEWTVLLSHHFLGGKASVTTYNGRG